MGFVDGNDVGDGVGLIEIEGATDGLRDGDGVG